MHTQPASLFRVASAALVLSATLAAQDAIPVSSTGAHVRVSSTGGVESAAVSRDGGSTWLPLPTPSYTINWRNRRIDPLVGDPSLAAALRADGANELFYVQFVTDVVPEYALALEQQGVEFTRYHPDQTLIARGARELVQGLAQQPYVRAVMELDPGHKLDGPLQAQLLSSSLQTATYNVMLVDKQRDAAALERFIVDVGGVLEAPAGGGVVLQATLTPAQLMAVMRENTVLWIDLASEPEYDMDNLRIQAGVDYVEIMAGMDGKGIRGHVNEGIHASHPEFGALPPYRTAPLSLMGSSSSNHGTNTAGEIYAQGLPGGVKGALPFAQAMFSPSIGSNRYAMVQALQDPGDVYQAMIMTQSWGASQTNVYTATSALLDDILFDFDHIFATNSQSNTGNFNSRPEAWAKNVAGIGGFNHFNNANPNDDCWCGTGSTGPAQDGRVGVSFAAYYDWIRTTDSSSSYTNTFGGTSGATPIVNGLAGGAIQMLTDGLFGYPAVPWNQRFAARPNLTTTRVLLAVSTRQLAFSGGATRVQQGWGLPNLQDLYDNRDNLLVLDEEDVIRQGQSRNYTVWVKPNTPEFRASMHHLEDEAVPSAIPTRINSLDLTVTAPNGNLYRGNGNGILTGPWSTPGGSANDVDIHENVFIQQPASGAYQVRVAAPVIRGDSHKETPQIDADFALAILGIGGGRDTSGIVFDLISNSTGHLEFAVSNLPATGWTHGFTVLSTATARHLSLGNYFGLQLSAFSENILAMTPSPGGRVAFTNTGNASQYPLANYQWPSSIASMHSGKTLDGVIVLFDAGGNVVDVSNVDRVVIQ